ncbi:MAG: hypothetical protein WCF36_16655 [Candidatus Nanopelagicales bacterium]
MAAQLTRVVTRAFGAADIHFHRPIGDWRTPCATLATTLIEDGATAIEVMGLLGYASLATTRRYRATRADQLRTAVRAYPARPNSLLRCTEPGPPARRIHPRWRAAGAGGVG